MLLLVMTAVVAGCGGPPARPLYYPEPTPAEAAIHAANQP